MCERLCNDIQYTSSYCKFISKRTLTNGKDGKGYDKHIQSRKDYQFRISMKI